MKDFFKRLLCRHDHSEFVRNIHGDEINVYDGKRSIWRCTKCKHTKAKGHLFDPEQAKNHLRRVQAGAAAMEREDNFNHMIAVANKVYAELCLKEMHLAKLQGSLIGERGLMVFETLEQIEAFVTKAEKQIIDFNKRIEAHKTSAQRIVEVAQRIGVMENVRPNAG